MQNNYLSVLYKHIIQVENENVGLKVCVCVGGGGAQTYHCPLPIKNQSQDATFSRLHTTEQDPINDRSSFWGYN